MEKANPATTTDSYACNATLSPNGYVPEAYQGTAADHREMQMLGKQQVMRRQFKFITMLGFASTVSKCRGYMCLHSSQVMLMRWPLQQW